MSSEPVRSSRERAPRVGDVFRHVEDLVAFRVTKTKDTQYKNSVDCEAVDCPGVFRWAGLNDWNNGEIEILESGPAPAESADGCRAPEWCGKPYEDDDVPAGWDGPDGMPFGVRVKGGNAQISYCSQSCCDRAAKPAKVASEDAHDDLCVHCGRRYGTHDAVDLACWPDGQRPSTLTRFRSKGIRGCEPWCRVLEGGHEGPCLREAEPFSVPVTYKHLQAVYDNIVTGRPPKPAPQPACTWVCSGDIHGPRCWKFVAPSVLRAYEAGHFYDAKREAIVGFYADRWPVAVHGYAEWSALQRGLEPDGPKIKAPRIRDLYREGEGADPDWVGAP